MIPKQVELRTKNYSPAHRPNESPYSLLCWPSRGGVISPSHARSARLMECNYPRRDIPETYPIAPVHRVMAIHRRRPTVTFDSAQQRCTGI